MKRIVREVTIDICKLMAYNVSDPIGFMVNVFKENYEILRDAMKKQFTLDVDHLKIFIPNVFVHILNTNTMEFLDTVRDRMRERVNGCISFEIYNSTVPDHIVKFEAINYERLHSPNEWFNYCRQDLCATGKLYERMKQIEEEKFVRRKLQIKEVKFNGPATIVFWTDGTKTVVKCQEGETFDQEKGLMTAIVKKVYGNEGKYYNKIRKALNEATGREIK